MNCPKCNNEMVVIPLKQAIERELVELNEDEDIPKYVYDELIENSSFAVCVKCHFVMYPPK